MSETENVLGAPGEPIVVGEAAPEFTLPEARGAQIRLSDLTRNEKVVLVFYRGGWCPLCSRQLADLSQAYSRFQAAGAEILAISNEEVAKGQELRAKAGPPFRLLHDPKGTVLHTYGLVVQSRDALGTMKRKHGYAHPATVVVGRDGKVAWKYVGKDYKDRPGVDAVLEAVAGAT